MMEQMLKYQEIDGKIKKIVYTLNHSDESVKGKKLGLFLKKAEENLKKMDRRSEELNSGVKKLKELYAQSIKDFDELEAGVEHAIDKNELNYISKKLADVSKNMAAIEKEISSVLREIDEIGKSYDDLKRKVPESTLSYSDLNVLLDFWACGITGLLFKYCSDKNLNVSLLADQIYRLLSEQMLQK